MNRKTMTAGLLALVALGATSAASAETEPDRWYLGASYGVSSLGHEASDFSDGSISDATIDDADTGWKIFAGRRLGDHLSIELGYVDFNNDVDNEATFSGSSDGSGSEFPAETVSVDLDEPRAAGVTLVGMLPLADRARVLAKVGAAAWQADLTTFSPIGSSTRAESGVDLTFGAGLEYRVGSRTELRLEWERYGGISGGDIDLASVGLAVRFGRSSR